MTLNQLRYFRAVCQHSSVSKAAEKLQVSQPSVSVAIKNLEEELGLTLVQRSNNKLSITAEGLALYKTVGSLLDQLDATISELQRQTQHQTPYEVRIGVPPVTGICVFPDIINDIHRKGGGFFLNVVEDNYVRLQQMVLNELIDCTLCLDDGEKFDGLRYDYVSSLELCFCVNRKNPLAEQSAVSFEQIRDIPIASLENDSYNYQKIDRLYRAHGGTPSVVFQANRPPAMLEFLRSAPECGMFLPREQVINDRDILPLSLLPRQYMDICIAYREESLENRKFMDFIHLLT